MSSTEALTHTNHNPILIGADDVQEEKMDIVEYWRSIKKRKYAILGLAAVVGLLAIVVVLVMTPVYRSSVTLLIETHKSKVVTIEDVYSGVAQNREYLLTQVGIMKSREVAMRAIMKTKIWESEEFDPRRKGATPIASLLDVIGFADSTMPKEWTEETLAEAVFPQFYSRLNIEHVRQSHLARISFDSIDAKLAATVANAMAEVYIESDLEARYKMTRQASGWLQERLGSLKAKLDNSERVLQGYREREGIIDVKGASQSGAGKQIDEVLHRLVEARMKRAEAENAYNQIKAAPNGSDLSSLPGVIKNPIIAEAKKQEADAERRLAEVSQRYAHEHPKYLQAESELKSARDNIRRQVDTLVTTVTREYEVARGTERALESVLGQAKGSVQSLNRKEFELNVLEREADANRQMYEMFMKRAKETNIAGDLQTPIARVVDPAVPSKRPVKPKKFLIVSLAVIFGLLIGAASSLLLDRLDNTLTPEDAEAKLRQPLLTTLPLLDKKQVRGKSAARFFLDDPQSIYAEAVRTARTGVLLSTIDAPKRRLVVTSSLAGEGKTTFSINLALAHAQTKKTLLIDADMRRPTIASALGIAVGSKGLTTLLAGAGELSECIHRIEGSELCIMPCGVMTPNPQEILLSQKFQNTLARLSDVFDVIIIDTPPVEMVSDALLLSTQATGVVFVVNAASTPYQLARKSLQRIRRAEGHVLGVVLNRLDFVKAEKYYGEYSAHGVYAGYQSVEPSRAAS